MVSITTPASQSAGQIPSAASYANVMIAAVEALAAAVTALEAGLFALDYQVVDTAQSTTSASYTNLSTAGPTATVTAGPSGKVLVLAFVEMFNDTAAADSHVGLSIDGAGAIDLIRVEQSSGAGGQSVSGSGVYMATGLSEAAHTFKLQYLANGGTASFRYRRIVAIPVG